MIGLKEQQIIAERIEQLILHETPAVLELEIDTLKLSLDGILPFLRAAVSQLKNT